MDKIILADCQFMTHLGVTIEERATLQPVSLDLELYTNIRSAGQSDSLSDTINYSAVHTALKDFITTHSFQLVEALAEQAAALILQTFPITKLTLRLKKPGAVNKKGGAYAAIEIARP